MRYIWQHIETILKTYNGSLPLSHFLKSYFKQYPKLGSRDRKILSDMVYCWYRCEKGLDKNLSFDDKIKTALLLCGNNSKHLLPFLPSDPEEAKQHIQFRLADIFPYTIALSDGITDSDWLQSMLSQPRMFIRIRKNKSNVINTLIDNNIPFEFITDTCLSLPNSSAIDKILNERDYVVQDASSQKTGAHFNPQKNEAWWDCCSGAGGKSLLLKDKEYSVELTVSDTRASIIHNLKKRFSQYNHTVPASFIINAADSSQLHQTFGNTCFDGIICDVPCTGSGTWARTPEQLYFFDTAQLDTISVLQKKIAINAAQYLKPGGKMYYITCSVFKEENENVVAGLLKNNAEMRLLSSSIINGIDIHADSMFIAVFTKKAIAS